MADKKSVRSKGKSRRARPNRGASLYAAVDLGTNNCRLLVAQPQGKTFRVVDSHSQIAALGEGLHVSGELSAAAIERAMAALKAISAKLREHRVAKVRCIATEACRRASNGADFVTRVQAETGLSFKIISAREEARLATIGCHDLIAEDAERVVVIDIGGGSTELSWLDAAAARAGDFAGLIDRTPILAWTSVPLGVVTLYDAFRHLPEDEAYPAMVNHAVETLRKWPQLETVLARLGEDRAHLIGTSGTVTCLAGVHLGLDRYRRDRVDGTWISRSDSQAVIEKVRSLDVEGRSNLPTIGAERAPLMLSGCAILAAVWACLPAERMRVGDRGLREGLLLTMMYGEKKPRRRRTRKRGKSAQAATPANASSEASA